MLRPTVAALVLSLLPVAAQARPALRPMRDTVVQYRVTDPVGQQTSEVTIHYASHGRRMRIEPAGRPSYMIVDRIAERMEVVLTAQHMYIDVPYDPGAMMKFEDPNAQFTQHGSDTVAGLRCTVYDVQSQRGSGQICLTKDGVMLRARGQGARRGGSLEAISVQYTPQPASLFVPPAGFRKMDAGQMPNAKGGEAPPR